MTWVTAAQVKSLAKLPANRINPSLRFQCFDRLLSMHSSITSDIKFIAKTVIGAVVNFLAH